MEKTAEIHLLETANPHKLHTVALLLILHMNIFQESLSRLIHS